MLESTGDCSAFAAPSLKSHIPTGHHECPPRALNLTHTLARPATRS